MYINQRYYYFTHFSLLYLFHETKRYNPCKTQFRKTNMIFEGANSRCRIKWVASYDRLKFPHRHAPRETSFPPSTNYANLEAVAIRRVAVDPASFFKLALLKAQTSLFVNGILTKKKTKNDKLFFKEAMKYYRYNFVFQNKINSNFHYHSNYNFKTVKLF